MRIIAGLWRGKTLLAPPGTATRPTNIRLRQAVFDRLAHAPWAPPNLFENALVLDLCAGTGAMGLEALSRGAAVAEFYESNPVTQRTLRANIAACKANATIYMDALRPAPGPPASLAFIDPPYHQDLLSKILAACAATGRIAPTTLIVAESAATEPPPPLLLFATTTHGKAAAHIGHYRP